MRAGPRDLVFLVSMTVLSSLGSMQRRWTPGREPTSSGGRVRTGTGRRSRLLPREEAAKDGRASVPRVSRFASFVRRHGFDILIPIAALESALEVAFRHDPGQSPTTPAVLACPS